MKDKSFIDKLKEIHNKYNEQGFSDTPPCNCNHCLEMRRQIKVLSDIKFEIEKAALELLREQ